MAAGSTARKVMACAVTLAATAAVLGLNVTGAAYSSAVSNDDNTFEASSFYAGTIRLNETFSTNFASSWDSNVWNYPNSSGTKSVSGGYASTISNSASPQSLAFSTKTDYGDQGVYLRHRFNTATSLILRIGVKCSDAYASTNAPTDCTWAEFSNTGTTSGGFVFQKTGTSGSGSGGSLNGSGQGWNNYRVEWNANMIQFKRWADGDSEPTAWARSVAIGSQYQRASGHLLLEVKNYSGQTNLESNFDDIRWYSLP